jgi:rubrerythrin
MTEAVETKTIATLEDLLAHAAELELEAVVRYQDLADQMDVHGNHEVAAFFRKMAEIEQKHVDKVERLSKGRDIPHFAPWEFAWETPESPEALDESEMHYLMTPWHAINLAMQGEQKAADFYAHVAERATAVPLQMQALKLCEEERDHVRLLEKMLAKFPKPKPGWDDDTDPPVEQE